MQKEVSRVRELLDAAVARIELSINGRGALSQAVAAESLWQAALDAVFKVVNAGDARTCKEILALEVSCFLFEHEGLARILCQPELTAELMDMFERTSKDVLISREFPTVLENVRDWLPADHCITLHRLWEEERGRVGDTDALGAWLLLHLRNMPQEIRVHLTWEVGGARIHHRGNGISWEEDMRQHAKFVATQFPSEFDNLLLREKVDRDVVRVLLKAWDGSVGDLLNAARSLS